MEGHLSIGILSSTFLPVFPKYWSTIAVRTAMTNPAPVRPKIPRRENSVMPEGNQQFQKYALII